LIGTVPKSSWTGSNSSLCTAWVTGGSERPHARTKRGSKSSAARCMGSSHIGECGRDGVGITSRVRGSRSPRGGRASRPGGPPMAGGRIAPATPDGADEEGEDDPGEDVAHRGGPRE